MPCPDPVAFTVFGHEIYWYGILISLSVVLAVAMVYFQAKKQGISTDDMLDYALLTVPVAIVFARIYYVAFEWENYASDPIRALYIWEGGIAIYGSIIGGVIATLIYAKWKKYSFWTLADLVAPGLVLGQAIGRWGNFFNQEAFGTLVTDASLQFFPYAVYIERLGQWHMATFFYESMTCLLIFVILLLYRKFRKNAPAGNLFLWYWVLYGVERFFVEGLRTDSLYIFKGGLPIGNLIFFPAGLRVSQALSLVMVIAFGITLIVRFIKAKKNPVLVEEAEAAPVEPEEAPAEEPAAEPKDELDPALRILPEGYGEEPATEEEPVEAEPTEETAPESDEEEPKSDD